MLADLKIICVMDQDPYQFLGQFIEDRISKINRGKVILMSKDRISFTMSIIMTATLIGPLTWEAFLDELRLDIGILEDDEKTKIIRLLKMREPRQIHDVGGSYEIDLERLEWTTLKLVEKRVNHFKQKFEERRRRKWEEEDRRLARLRPASNRSSLPAPRRPSLPAPRRSSLPASRRPSQPAPRRPFLRDPRRRPLPAHRRPPMDLPLPPFALRRRLRKPSLLPLPRFARQLSSRSPALLSTPRAPTLPSMPLLPVTTQGTNSGDWQKWNGVDRADNKRKRANDDESCKENKKPTKGPK